MDYDVLFEFCSENLCTWFLLISSNQARHNLFLQFLDQIIVLIL